MTELTIYILYILPRKYENVLESERVLLVARYGEWHNGFCRSMLDLLAGEEPLDIAQQDSYNPYIGSTVYKFYLKFAKNHVEF